MLSRALCYRALFKNFEKTIAKQSQRNSGHGVWSYRIPPPLPSKKSVLIAEVVGGLCWWWIFYHIATQYDHILGEFPYTDPKLWTDEELGIPPDSVGPLKN